MDNYLLNSGFKYKKSCKNKLTVLKDIGFLFHLKISGMEASGHD
jgi:hypothetical protein